MIATSCPARSCVIVVCSVTTLSGEAGVIATVACTDFAAGVVMVMVVIWSSVTWFEMGWVCGSGPAAGVAARLVWARPACCAASGVRARVAG
jgi:hypothetical protein